VKGGIDGIHQFVERGVSESTTCRQQSLNPVDAVLDARFAW
jgi:hypothetical protein